MIFIIYSDTTAASIGEKLGLPEYSYYFVLKEYRPVLEQMGKVVVVTDPATEVDPIFAECQAWQEPCLFLSFSPPNKTALGLACPTVPVLAWEFDTIPNEVWNNDPINDWRNVFGKLGWAITHSQFAVKIIKAAMGDDFPVVSIPAPVWDRFDEIRGQVPHVTCLEKTRLMVTGEIFDSRTADLSVYAPNRQCAPPPSPEPAAAPPALQEEIAHADAPEVIEALPEEAPSESTPTDVGEHAEATTLFPPEPPATSTIEMEEATCVEPPPAPENPAHEVLVEQTPFHEAAPAVDVPMAIEEAATSVVASATIEVKHPGTPVEVPPVSASEYSIPDWTPSPPKTFRNRLAITKRYVLGWYEEVIRDLLPIWLDRLIAVTGRRINTASYALIGTGWRPPPAKPQQVEMTSVDTYVMHGGSAYSEADPGMPQHPAASAPDVATPTIHGR